MKAESRNISELIAKNIRETKSNVEIILYGSRARGDEKTDSDWDILVLTNEQNSMQDESKLRAHLYELELEIEAAISLSVYSKENWKNQQSITPFYQNISTEGIVL